jgi:Lrp/AsnC family transcriptional regulator for asnA, asnC and gidA
MTATRSKIDDLDRRIISRLQSNGRITNTELARNLGVSEATIRARVGRMVSEELINIVAVPTPRAVGMTLSAIVGISVVLPRLEEITRQLTQQPEVRYAGISTGRYDLILECFFSDQDHLLRFLSESLGSLDGVRQVETSVILRVAKFSYEWEIPPE